MFRYLFLLTLCPFLGGCLAVGYPSETVTPTVVVPDSDVHVFKTATYSKGTCVLLTGGYRAGWQIHRVPVVDGQIKPITEKHFPYWAGGPLISWHDKRWWSLYLYRPGYDIVEISPGMACLSQFRPDTVQVDWTPLATADEQARVIDKLAGRGLWENATSEFRRFCADEYDKLALRFPAASHEDRQIWQKKAEDLRRIGTGRDPTLARPVNFPPAVGRAPRNMPYQMGSP